MAQPILKDYICAGYPVLAVRTHEQVRAFKTCEEEITALNKKKGQNKVVASFDIVRGIVNHSEGREESQDDPIAAVSWLLKQESDTILFWFMGQEHWDNLGVIQLILNNLEVMKSDGKTIVFITLPNAKPPMALDRIVTLLEFNLPDTTALHESLDVAVKGADVKMPNKNDIESLLKHGRGLTLEEFENSLSLSLVKHGTFVRETLIAQKAQMLQKSAGLRFGYFKETFDDIGGLDVLKEFLLSTVHSPLSKGVILVGVPGTGKTLTAKALGNVMNLPTIIFEPAATQSRYVGDTGLRMRSAIDAILAQGEVVVMIDEIEKAFAGSTGTGELDSGTKKEITGIMLQFLDDPGDCYVIVTCNDLSSMPPELQRSGRWDSIFFVDLPNAAEREAIWDIHKCKYGISSSEYPDATDWSGADIETCCRIAAMRQTTMKEAARFVVPLSKSRKDVIEDLRARAKGMAVMANSETVKKPVLARKILKEA